MKVSPINLASSFYSGATLMDLSISKTDEVSCSWTVEARHHRSSIVSHSTSDNQICHANMSSQCAFPGPCSITSPLLRPASPTNESTFPCSPTVPFHSKSQLTFPSFQPIDRRNLPLPPQRLLVPRLYPHLHSRSHTPTARVSGSGESIERRYSGTVERRGSDWWGESGEVLVRREEVEWMRWVFKREMIGLDLFP